MNQNKIFIYGVPGTGKTTFSRLLQQKLGYPLIEADELRSIAQKDHTQDKQPFLYLSTTDAYKNFGQMNETNIMKGLQAVREALDPYVQEKEVSKLQADYLKKRYGKDVKVVDQ